jgi:hypothetical protein
VIDLKRNGVGLVFLLRAWEGIERPCRICLVSGRFMRGRTSRFGLFCQGICLGLFLALLLSSLLDVRMVG